MSYSRSAFVVSFITVALGVHGVASAARPCPTDINYTGAVDIDDLLSVINAWGQSAVPADVNGSGAVDIDDLLNVINEWGTCLFDYGPVYPNTEAHQIGLEMLGSGGPLTLPQQMYDRIDRDLGLIRTEFPALVPETHTLAWAPTQLIVNVPNLQAPDYLCHNTFYQVTGTQHLFSTWYVLTFAGKFNVPAMAQLYMTNAAVTFAEPNGLIGGQNFWVPTNMGNGVWRWNIDDGFHDCFDGCDCHRYYVIDVDAAGKVTLISYVEQGQSWCDFGTTK